MTETDRSAPHPLTRRAVVATTGAAWAAPVVTALTAAPAFAVSAGRAAAITVVTPTSEYPTESATSTAVTLTAKVTDVDGAAVAGAVVTFTLAPEATWTASFGASATDGQLTATAVTDTAGLATASYAHAKPTQHAALLRTTASVATAAGPVTATWRTRFRGWVLPTGGRGAMVASPTSYAIAGTRLFTWGTHNSSQRGTARSTPDYIPGVLDYAGVGAFRALWHNWSNTGAIVWSGLRSDGTVIAGGQSFNGALAGAAGTAVTTAPGSDLPAGAVTTGAYGGAHQAFVAAGNVYVSGKGGAGEIGRGATGTVTVAKAVYTAPTGGSELPAGRTSAVAVASLLNSVAFDEAVIAIADGLLYGWGSMPYLASGAAAAGSQTTPKALVTATANTAADGVLFSQVSAGNGFVVALGTRNGVSEVYSWGTVADQGRLGNGSTTSVNGYRIGAVTVLPAGRTWVKVVAGQGGAMALSRDGEVWVWGALRPGDGSTTQPLAGPAVQVKVPAQTQGQLVRFTDIAICSAQFALADTGVLYAWGGSLPNGVNGTQTLAGTGTLLTATPVDTTRVMSG